MQPKIDLEKVTDSDLSKAAGGSGQVNSAAQAAGQGKVKVAEPHVSDHIALYNAVIDSKQGTRQDYIKEHGLNVL